MVIIILCNVGVLEMICMFEIPIFFTGCTCAYKQGSLIHYNKIIICVLTCIQLTCIHVI